MKIEALENDAKRQYAENEEAVANYQRELERTKKKVDQCEARIANMLSDNELDQRKHEEERGRSAALSEQCANLERSQHSLREQLRSTEEQNQALRTAADRAESYSRVAQLDRIGELTAENSSLRAELASETNKLRAEFASETNKLRAETSAKEDSLAYAKNQAAEKDLKINELARKLSTARAAGSGSGPCPLCPELKEKIAKLEQENETLHEDYKACEAENGDLRARIAMAPPAMKAGHDDEGFVSKKAHDDAIYACLEQCRASGQRHMEHMADQFHERYREQMEENEHLLAENERLTAENELLES